MPDADGTHIFESLQLEGAFVGDLLYSSQSCVHCVCGTQLLTLCDSMDCSLPGSSVRESLQARILEWVAISFSRGSSRSRDPPGSPALQEDSLPAEFN